MSAECSAGNIPSGYKQTEVGVIPEDWSIKKLDEISIISRLAGAEYTSLWKETYDGEIIALRGFNIGKGKIVEKDLVHISNELSLKLKRSRLCKGDVVYPCVGSIGNAVVISEDEKYHIQQNIARITPNPEAIRSSYLANYLMSFLGEREVARFNASSSQPNVLVGSLRQYRIPLPSTLTEQEYIAEALSDADALIESLEQLITKKCQIKQGSMQELLTGKKRLPGFSGEWEVKLLGDLFEFSGGLSASRDQLSTEGYCYLHYGDIHISKKTFIDVKKEKQDIPKLDIPLKKVSPSSLLESGDVVFVDASEDEEGASKHIIIFNEDKIPFISGLHTIVAKSKTRELDYQYRRYCFQTSDIKQQFRFFAVGTKVFGISKTNIAKITLPVPSVEEQNAIATILSDMDSEITALEEKLAKARQIKQGMMQELLTGRVRLV